MNNYRKIALLKTTPKKLHQHQYSHPETKDGTFPQLTSPLRRKAQDPCFPLLLHRFIRLISSRFRSRRHQDSNRERVTSYPEIYEPRRYMIPFACPRTVNLHLHVRQTFLSLSLFLQDIPNRGSHWFRIAFNSRIWKLEGHRGARGSLRRIEKYRVSEGESVIGKTSHEQLPTWKTVPTRPWNRIACRFAE